MTIHQTFVGCDIGKEAVDIFDLVEAQHLGLGTTLKHRAQQLVGGRNSPPGRSAAGLIGEGVVDLFLGYASNARLHEEDPTLSVVELPPKLSPRIEYGVILRIGASEPACQLREFLLSRYGQDLLEASGFQRISGSLSEAH